MPVKRLVKAILQAVAPGLTLRLMAARSRAHSHRLVAEWGLRGLNARLAREVGPQVLAGPFAGLVLTPDAFHEHVGPFLLGTYERELHPWWEELAVRPFPQIVDVGAKFGYYAVGLARRYPAAAVVAYDVDWWARRACRRMAAANGVGNVTVLGECRPAWFGTHLAPGALIVCDCEGCEKDLFGTAPDTILRTCTLVIETHDEIVAGTTDALRGRFARTHDIREVGVAVDPPAPALDLKTLSAEELTRLSRQLRPDSQRWLLLTPREGGPS